MSTHNAATMTQPERICSPAADAGIKAAADGDGREQRQRAEPAKGKLHVADRREDSPKREAEVLMNHSDAHHAGDEEYELDLCRRAPPPPGQEEVDKRDPHQERDGD